MSPLLAPLRAAERLVLGVPQPTPLIIGVGFLKPSPDWELRKAVRGAEGSRQKGRAGHPLP